jgi:hypothetical protein
MSQREDIQELLEGTRNISFSLSTKYEQAKIDNSITQIDRASVKSALEHLRSILEYCAIDIYTHIYGKQPNRIYFPIGKDKEQFDRHLTDNFAEKKDKLFENKNPEIYKLISSIQPYSAGSNWLIDLNSYVNKNKHNKLTSQNKETENSFSFANLIRTNGNSNTIIFKNTTINGLPIGKDSSGDVVIIDTMTNDEINSQLNPDLYLPIRRTVEDVKFYIDGSENDALTFIQEVTKKYLGLLMICMR